MLIFEYINVSSKIAEYWEHYFPDYVTMPLTESVEYPRKYNGVIVTNRNIGKIHTFLVDNVTRIIDTTSWGFLINKTNLKFISEERKENYMFLLLSNKDFYDYKLT